MKIYIGYPDSFLNGSSFRLKDNFFKEVKVNYNSVPVEVKRKILSLLDNIAAKDYIYIDNIFYDASDIVEFALFPLSELPLNEVVVPGYLYGKPTFVLREVFGNVFRRNVTIYYDFNLFAPETVVVNVGYKTTSISFGGKFLTVIPLGEYHLVDTFGNYLFNRFVLETGLSNAELRKQGLRGELLDRFRGLAGKILFKGESRVFIDDFDYTREVSDEEVKLVLSMSMGSSNYGDLVDRPFDFSSSVISSLYEFEEVFRERPKVRDLVLIGRLTLPFKEALQRIFPIPAREMSGSELLELPVFSSNSRTRFRRISFSSKNLIGSEDCIEGRICDVSIRDLRRYFNRKDVKGVVLIENLSGKLMSEAERESFVTELLSIVKRCAYRTREGVAYMNYAISALSKLDIPENLFNKVIELMISKAFDWYLPFETKKNILYFCFKFSDRISDERLRIFLPLMVTYLRDKQISEGDRNFVKTVVKSIYSFDRRKPASP